MRTTRPERTCVSISDSGESATRASISTPRLIGPGCMTTWPGPQPLGRDTPAGRVLAQAGHEVLAGRHPLLLHAQHVDDVGASRSGRYRSRPRSPSARSRAEAAPAARCRSTCAPTIAQRLHERARHARVEDVADDRHLQPVQAPERLLHRVEVEQRLGRVLVLAVAGVDDVRAGGLGDQSRRPDLGVADDDHVRLVGRERARGVLERLALVDRGAGGADRHHVGREPLRRQLEAGGGARRGLEEEVHDRAPAQGRQLLHLALQRAGEVARGGEQALDDLAVEVLDRDQMPFRRRRRRCAARRRSRVYQPSSAPSVMLSSYPWDGALRLLGRGDQQDGVLAVDLGQLHLDAAPGARWAGSCRRSRGGSEARGGRGRRAPPAARARAGRSRTAPRSPPGSCGRCRGRRRRGCRSCPRAESRARSPARAAAGAAAPRRRAPARRRGRR